MTTVFDTFPWPQFDVSPSAARRAIVVEQPAKNRPSSVGATSSEYAAPDGAKSKSTTAGYKDAAPDGTAPKNAVLPRDAIAKIDAVAAAARELRRVRAEALPKLKGGLRALYHTLELTRSLGPRGPFASQNSFRRFPNGLKCPARIR